MGYLASRTGPPSRRWIPAGHDLRSAIASFTVEAFSTERLQGLSREEIDARLSSFRALTEFRV